MSVGCTIIKDFPRPAPELTARFKGLPVANIDDCMGRIAAVDAAIVPFGCKGQLLGPAFTVRVPAGDNLMFHAAMDLAKPGDVIVIDAGGYTQRAILGELMAAYCRSRGIVGIICDGAIRDSAALAAMENFQVYARAATPNGPYKNGPGEINVPVVIGGKIVCPGDIVVADQDGILFIPPSIAETLANAAETVEASEKNTMENIVRYGTFPRPWVGKKLEELHCEVRE